MSKRLPLGLIIACIYAYAGACAAQDDTAKDAVRVELNTALGPIRVEVSPQAAPLSACDFLGYVDAGLYAGAAFYRTVRLDNDHGEPKIEVVQGGLQDESKERPPVAHESTRQTKLKHVDGALSLARGAVGTGSAAAFFIVINDQPGLDYGGSRNKDGQGFAVFGRVTSGMDIVRHIHRMEAKGPTEDAYLQGQLLSKPVLISGAKRLDPLPEVCRSR